MTATTTVAERLRAFERRFPEMARRARAIQHRYELNLLTLDLPRNSGEEAKPK
jgi:hypothetical protein